MLPDFWLSQGFDGLLAPYSHTLSIFCFTVNVSERSDHQEIMDYFSQQAHTHARFGHFPRTQWMSGRYGDRVMWVTIVP